MPPEENEKTFTVQEVELLKAQWESAAKDKEIEALKQRVTSPPEAREARQGGAIAGSAPNKVDAADQSGLVNLFALKPERLAQMTPDEMRGHMEKILEYGRSVSGAPKPPTPESRRRGGR
jgi:hypothetical protein